ncbi:hypothetical protein L210DRAFT_3535104 [Boletus edulis BED1]|uniref:Uncharacterized protein n=1 Tax=Boletus edulis BED1 TaxID=1328754 RepID=A0AAD4GH13_BOLED|nr:hypothetical protein L210DRAFT_3535104 [Boletus edulis BED1]
MYRLSVKLLRCGPFILFRSSLVFLIFTAALTRSVFATLVIFFHCFEVALSLTFYFILKGVVKSQRREKHFVGVALMQTCLKGLLGSDCKGLLICVTAWYFLSFVHHPHLYPLRRSYFVCTDIFGYSLTTMFSSVNSYSMFLCSP